MQKHAVLSAMVAKQLLELAQQNGAENIEAIETAEDTRTGKNTQSTILASLQPGLSIRGLIGLSCFSAVFVVALFVVFFFLRVRESKITTASEDARRIVQEAIECDAEADSVSPSKRKSAIDRARKELGNAIATLGIENSGREKELRRLLIQRLLQLGGNWCREAERQIVLLDEAPGNPAAVKWMALALVGQLQESMNDDRISDKFEKQSDYWNWLSHQKTGETLLRAIELNPTDVQLLANLVEVSRNNLDAFKFSGINRDSNQAWLRERVARKLIKIEANEDSRSRLIRYRFQRNSESHLQGISDLSRGFKAAANRLRDPIQLDELVVDDRQELWLDPSLPARFWDYVLVKELGDSTSSPAVANDCYRLLIKIESNWMPAFIREETYVAAGEHFLAQGDPEEALRTWRLGLARADANSLRLNGAVADVSIKSNTIAFPSEKMLDALNRFQNSIELATIRLANAPYTEASNVDRRAAHHEIQIARWKMNVLDAVLQTKSRNQLKAIEVLESTLVSQLDIDTSQRVDALIRLAKLYDEQGASDNAAATFDRAISLSPEDYEIRVQAAEAWNRAGDCKRSNDHWRLVSQSESIGLKIASLEAMFAYELTRPTAEQRFHKIRSAVEAIRKQTNDSIGGFGDEAWLGRLSILEFSLPPNGVAIQSHLESLELTESIANLASEFKNDEAVQRFAADYFAANGNRELSIAAIKRIEFFSGKNSFAAVVAQSRIEAAAGQIKIACQRLQGHASHHPENSERALLIASSWARQFEQRELAYELLLAIPQSRRSAFILYSIANAAKELPLDGPVIQRQNMRPIELALLWKSKLIDFEGEKGSWWKFLEATWLVDHIRNAQTEIAKDDPRLMQSKVLISQLNVSRPYWNKVMSLEGAIYAVEKNPIQAIKHLKRGIAAGDDRIQTQQLLLLQLQLLNPGTQPRKQNIAFRNSTFSSASVEIFLHAHACLKRNLEELPARYVAERSYAKNWFTKAIK